MCCGSGDPGEAISDDLSLDSESSSVPPRREVSTGIFTGPLRLARQPPATVHFHHLTAVDGSLAREQVFLVGLASGPTGLGLEKNPARPYLWVGSGSGSVPGLGANFSTAIGAKSQVIDLTDGNETPGNQLQISTGWLLTTTVDNTNQDWIVADIF
ncbi:hypothetical protein B0H13DRAFT_1901630 [Mycena leptocephala]|nr:hypothetical protein B0H13DRAFT_1901630 [Mycena leptocephala]